MARLFPHCALLAWATTYDRSFRQRIVDEYRGQKNFYALAYDQDEVIDAVCLSFVDSADGRV